MRICSFERAFEDRGNFYLIFNMLTKIIFIVLLKLPFLLGNTTKRDAAFERWPRFDGRMWDKNWLLFKIESVSLIQCSALCKSHRLCENHFYNVDNGMCTGGHLRMEHDDIEQFGHEEGSALYLGKTTFPKVTSPVGLESPSSSKTVDTLDHTTNGETTEADTEDWEKSIEVTSDSSKQTTDIAEMSKPPFITTTVASEVKYTSTNVEAVATTQERIGTKYYIVRNADMGGGQAICREMAHRGHLVWIGNATENRVVWKLLQDKGMRQAYIGSIWNQCRNSLLYYNPTSEPVTFHAPLVPLDTMESTIQCISMRTEEMYWIVGNCNSSYGCVCEQDF